MSKKIHEQKDLPSEQANAFEPAVAVDTSELMTPLAQNGPFKWHGPVSRLAMRVRLVPALMEHLHIERAEAIAQFREYSDAVLLQVVNTVATAKGVVLPAALGDGEYFKKFLDFLIENWDEILKLFLLIIGGLAVLGLAAKANKGPEPKPKHPIPESEPKPKTH